MQKLQINKLTIQKVSLPIINVYGSIVNEKDNNYIKNGLVFHLDGIDKGPNEGAWTDLVGGVQYPLNGNATTYDAVCVTNTMKSDTLVNFPITTHSIEVCLRCDRLGSYFLFNTGGKDSVGLQFYSSGNGHIFGGSYSSKCFTPLSKNTKVLTASFTYDNAIVNGDKLTIDPAYNGLYKYYDNRFVNDWASVNPYVYSIRIYDRLLTEAEMRHNQEVDYKRFDLANVGKTIVVTSTEDIVTMNVNNTSKTYSVIPNSPSRIVIDEAHSFNFRTEKGIFVQYADFTNLDMSKVTSIEGLFRGNKAIKYVTMNNCNTSKVSSTGGLFQGCETLASVDMTNCDLGALSYYPSMFHACHALKDIKFGKNLKVSINFSSCPLTHDSALSVINGLYNFKPNLLLDSKFERNDKSGWVNTLEVKEDNGINYITPEYYWTCWQRLDFENDNYTFSALVRNTGDEVSKLRLFIEDASGGGQNIYIDVEPNTDWHRVYGSLMVPEQLTNARIFILLFHPNTPQTLDVAEVKLEKGINTNPTWSPALSETTNAPTVTFKSTTYNTLTDEEIAMVTSKGFNIASA